MSKPVAVGCALILQICAILAVTPAAAETVLKTEAWECNNAAFDEMSKRIVDRAGRNLLAREETEGMITSNGGFGDLNLLVDSDAGTVGQAGRCFVQGNPAVVAFYLGGPKVITEVGVFSGNVDTRANQDYEVRLVDNSAKPGEMPSFAGPPTLTTGDKVLGPGRGGFHTAFVTPQGGPLTPGKADWVQFRFWSTYTAKAGDRAKCDPQRGAGVLVELEVLGEAGDVVKLTADEMEYRKSLRSPTPVPELTKKNTWQETLIAGRETIWAWETQQDRLAVRSFGLQLGPWYSLGPVPARDPLVKQLQSLERIDVDREVLLADGRKLTWQRRDTLRDGQIQDLASADSLGKDAVVFLCRDVKFRRKVGKKELRFEVCADRGSALWLPERQRLSVYSPLGLTSGGTMFTTDPRASQLLVELRPAADGHCRFFFQPRLDRSRPGGGNIPQRAARRLDICSRVSDAFPGAVEQAQIRWESADGIWDREVKNSIDEWLPGYGDAFAERKYRQAIQRRAAQLQTLLSEMEGIAATVMASRKEALATWLKENGQVPAKSPALAELRNRYYALASVHEAIDLAAHIESIRLAVEDQQTTFGDQYPRASERLARVAAAKRQSAALWGRLLAGEPAASQAVLELTAHLDKMQAEILLDTPLLSFDKLLLAKGGPSFASNWGGPNHLGREIVALSPVRPDGKLTTVHQGPVSDMDLHWDADRILFSDGRVLWEIKPDGSDLRRVSVEDPPITHYDGCYLPNGKIMAVSNACEQAVPCTGGADVGNMHVLDADGRNERRLTYDQDHNWNPVIMHDGRVLYTRWEYADLPHYFSRMLFRMNPDGTGQMEYYGSGSYWPNAMYWPRPIPGHPTMVVCVVSGHHGVSRVGELVLLDPARGRHEADGAIQRLPGYGKKVPPIIRDNLVGDSWPKFASPWPLAEPGTNRGAGKYFLASVQKAPHATWDLCLVDVFDNITPIVTGGFAMPIPLRARPKPPVIPSHIDLERRDALVYVADIYQGEGLRGYPRGSIKRLRVGTHHYRYAGNGDTRASSLEGGWDVKRIMGTVPVRDDGSVLFRAPANTPIFLQPLDEEGKAQQQMRSWYTAMPGEIASCVGCHEKQNRGPPISPSSAALAKPSEIEPFFGPVRGYSFDREVQPVLDRRCAGCHNGHPYRDQDRTITTIDLRAKQLHTDWQGDYSPAYVELQRYVRRAGYEADCNMAFPAEFEADTSVLVQLLKKGHYNVQLDAAEWQRLYTWIDYNIPYPANWRESHRPPRDAQVELRAKYKSLFAKIDDHDEDALPIPPVAAFEAPKPASRVPRQVPSVTNWPFTPTQAQERQKAAGQKDLVLELGGGVSMKFALVPAGRFVMGDPQGFADEQAVAEVAIAKPYYLGVFEVTNQQYNCYDSKHDSAYIDGRWKDRTTRGMPANQPDQPVIRITWNEAMAFCEWLSQRTGRRCTLPTEAEWEWACRAGSAARYNWGEYRQGVNNLANLADRSVEKWNFGRCEPGYEDGAAYSIPGGRYAPNAWGLCDMHGNVAEWCLTAYRPYPYCADDGRDAQRAPGRKVVRGGSWSDTMALATSAWRWRYPAHQPVYNVGFRVKCEMTPSPIAQEPRKPDVAKR